MPKVETSQSQGGKFSNEKIHVSLANGIEIFNQNSLIRNERELHTVISDENKNTNTTKRRRKVIKKLVRVQLLKNDLNENAFDDVNQSTEATEITTKRLRRRLLIKKKKKRRLIVSGSLENEEHLQQATKPRRKVIITKKRLLPSKSEYNETEHPNEILFSSVTNMLSSSMMTMTHSRYMDHMTFNEESTNDGSSEELDPFDSTQDDLTESYEATTSEEDGYDFDTESNSLFDSSETPEDSFEQFEDSSEVPEDSLELPEDSSELPDNYSSGETLDKLLTGREGRQFDDSSTLKNNIESSEVEEDEDEINNQPTFQDIPEYEPSFPELTESLDSPVLHLKTTVLSSVEYLTTTTVLSRLRTYTFVVTRLSGNEEIVTSTTEVKPQIKTTVVTEPFTTYTTLTLLDFDSTDDVTIKDTKLPNLENFSSLLLNQGEFSFV